MNWISQKLSSFPFYWDILEKNLDKMFFWEKYYITCPYTGCSDIRNRESTLKNKMENMDSSQKRMFSWFPLFDRIG